MVKYKGITETVSKTPNEPERKIPMKRFLKIFLALVLMITALALTSCGNGAANPEDANGEWGDILWRYEKGSHTLTLKGSGKMPNAESSDAVPWKEVRSAVTAVKFDIDEEKSLDSIGDYAFYGMSKLEEIKLPEGVQSIGKCSFAFCSLLEEAKLPSTLVSLGDSAFEACASLTEISLPASTVEIGEGAFAFCRGLTSVTVNGAPEQIKKWTFRDCTSLKTLRLDKTLTALDSSALDGAAIDANGVKSLRTSVVSVVCKDEEGKVIGGNSNAAVIEVDEVKEIDAPSIEGYELKSESKQIATGTGEPVELVFEYAEVKEEASDEATAPDSTEAPAASENNKNDEDGGVDVMAIVAIVIFAVVIIGIIVGAILLIRSDANTTKDSMTVRKNKDGKKSGANTEINKNNAKKGKKK